MRILLLDLGTQREEYNEPLGLEILHACLENLNYSIESLIKWYPESGLPNSSEVGNCDLIAVSVNSGTLSRLDKLLTVVRGCKKRPTVIVGNTLSTFAFEKILELYPEVICVRGEGEISLPALVNMFSINSLIQWNELSKIPNLAFSIKGKIITTSRRVVDLTTIPAPNRAFTKFLAMNGGISRIENSRGCSWSKCSFCCVKEKYGVESWRPFPISYIINQLEILGEQSRLNVYFTDEDFFGGEFERAIVLAKEIFHAKKQGSIPPDQNFFISILARDVLDPSGYEALVELKKAGLREVFVGVESGCDEQLKRFRKNANARINMESLQLLKNIGLQIDIGFIMFDPLMTMDELLINVQFLEDIEIEVDSRFAKSLRLQPFTVMEIDSSKAITGILDYDELMYPYRFLDEKVDRVFKNFSIWDNEQKAHIHAIQAELRGEGAVKSKSLTRKCLAMLRKLDYKVLTTTIENVQGEIDVNEYLVNMVSFRQERETLFIQNGG